MDVTADMYPYVACGTGLTAVLPPWAGADGKLFENLRDPAMRAQVRAEVLNPSGDWEAHGRAGRPGRRHAGRLHASRSNQQLRRAAAGRDRRRRAARTGSTR